MDDPVVCRGTSTAVRGQPVFIVTERVGPLRPKANPIARGRYLWQLTVGRSAQEKLDYARELLSHKIPSGDMAEVLERGLEALIARLEKRKLRATDRPRKGRRPVKGRTIPACVRRAVWERDGGQCTFSGDNSRGCSARKFLEYDHRVPVAHGGEATETNLRLQCRAHNQLEAERVFGEGFMLEKRQIARTTRLQHVEASEESTGILESQTRDVMAGLRELGFRAHEARRAAVESASVPGATLEEQMRGALKYLCPRSGQRM